MRDGDRRRADHAGDERGRRRRPCSACCRAMRCRPSEKASAASVSALCSPSPGGPVAITPPLAKWRISSVTKSAAKTRPIACRMPAGDAVAPAAQRLAREEHGQRRQAEAEDEAVEDRRVPISAGVKGGPKTIATQASAATSDGEPGEQLHRPVEADPDDAGRAERERQRDEARREPDGAGEGERQHRAGGVERRGRRHVVVRPARDQPFRHRREDRRHDERRDADRRPRLEGHVAEIDDDEDDERRAGAGCGEEAGGARRGRRRAVGAEEAAEADDERRAQRPSARSGRGPASPSTSPFQRAEPHRAEAGGSRRPAAA